MNLPLYQTRQTWRPGIATLLPVAAVARLSVGISITHTLIVIAAFYNPTPHPATAAAVARVASLLCNLNGGGSGAGSALHSGPTGRESRFGSLLEQI